MGKKSRATVVEEHIADCISAIKDGRTQNDNDSLVFISQSLIDISFTLALIYDEMKKESEGEDGSKA